MSTIVLDFGSLKEELRNKQIELYISENNNSFYIKDRQSNIYEIERYFHNSYLDRLISDGRIATFHRVSNEVTNILKNQRLEQVQ